MLSSGRLCVPQPCVVLGVDGVSSRISCALSTLIVTLLTWASQPPRGLLLSQFLLDHEVLQALRPLIHRVCAACLVHVCALVLVKSVNIVLAVMQEQCALGPGHGSQCPFTPSLLWKCPWLRLQLLIQLQFWNLRQFL